jgi:two-component system sensor histidine kinase RpfC
LEVRIDPDTPYRLRGDPARISQILVNLIGNAVKFTERGYVRLKVFPLREDSTKTRVRFEVLDTGIGIPAEAQERIFDYFTQADESTARQYGGTGLGTAIAKRLVERMGGHLGVNSTVDEGSCFWFEVPLAKQPEPTPVSTQRVISGLRALVVSAATRDSAAWSQALRGWEIETAIVRDGNGAVEAIREAVKQRLPFTTILVDERVTGRSAKAFPSELLRNIAGSATSVLLIGSPGETGEADDDLTDSGYAAIVRRPVDEARLYRALRATREVVQDQAGTPAPQNPLRSTEKSLRILVAEDNPTNQFVIRNLLQEAGHRPCIVGDGKAALRVLETDKFDLAIMDMHMPGFSGHEVVERHRQDRPGSDVPIIMLTADATPTAATVAHAAGVEAYLTKPVSAGVLLAAIRRHALKVSPEIPAGDAVAQATATAASRPMGASVVGEQQLVLQADVLERLRENIKTPDFVSQLVNTYIGDAKRNLEIIEKGFSNGAWDAVRHAAHDLKGASSAVGAEQVMRSCASVEQVLRENREKELGRHVRRLSSEVSAVIKALEPYR